MTKPKIYPRIAELYSHGFRGLNGFQSPKSVAKTLPNLEFVIDAEHSKHPVGRHTGELFIHSVGYDALQRNFPICHNDVDGRIRAHRIFRQWRVEVEQ